MQTEAERRALLVLAASDDRLVQWQHVPANAFRLFCKCGHGSSPLNVNWGIWRECRMCQRIWCIEE